MDEGPGRREEAEEFSRCCVDGPDEVMDILGAVVAELGLSRQVAPQVAVCVLDGATPPGGVEIAEEGLHGEILVEPLMASELGAVVEGDGAPGGLGQGGKAAAERGGDGLGGSARQGVSQGQPGLTLAEREQMAPFLCQTVQASPQTRRLSLHRRPLDRHQPLPRRDHPWPKTLHLDRKSRQNYRRRQMRAQCYTKS